MLAALQAPAITAERYCGFDLAAIGDADKPEEAKGIKFIVCIMWPFHCTHPGEHSSDTTHSFVFNAVQMVCREL